MRRRSLSGGPLAAMAVAGLIAGCGDPASKLPSGPTPTSFSAIEITGPATVAPGQSAQFTATIRLADGTIKTASTATTVVWRSSNAPLLQVSASGVVTAGQVRGEATLTVDAPNVGGSGTRRSTREVVIVPDGTYRLVGFVSDAEYPSSRLAGARIEVLPGLLVAATNSTGQYRLYGVPPDADIQVTKDSYQPWVQSVHLTGHATQNFPMTLSGPRPDLAGNYTLAIDVLECPGSPQLPDDLRHRTYDAVLTQNTATAMVDVTLTEPRFKINSTGRGNRFSGHVDATGATFLIEGFDGLAYYPYYGTGGYPHIAEQLSNGTILVVAGTAVMTASSAGLSGVMTGSVGHWASGFPTSGAYLGGCGGTGALQISLTRR